MVNLAIIAVIVILATAISGYFLLPYFNFNSDPKQMLKDYENKLRDVKNIKLGYIFKMSMFGMFNMPQISIDTYKLNGDTKSVVSYMGATSAVYVKGDKTITCTEGSISSVYSSTSLSCKITGESQLPVKTTINEELYNQSVVAYNGVKKIIGRGCDDFVIYLNETNIKELQNSMPLTGLAIQQPNITAENKTRIAYEVCMDKQYGYVALLNMSIFAYSKLSGKIEEVNLMSMEAIGMSTDVTTNDMMIPVAFILGKLNCSNSLVRFTMMPMQDIIGPTMNLKLSSYNQNISVYKTMDKMTSGLTYSIEMPITATLKTSYYTAEVCIGTDCQSDYCYISSYSSSSTTYYPTYP